MSAASPIERFAPLFEPATIAVVGASSSSVAAGNRFIRHLKAYGFAGRIVPIHPSASEIEGLPASASVQAAGIDIDYAYVAVAATQVADVIRSFRGRVRVAQVMSSGFAETDGGSGIERELAQAARDAGVRVVGPNCLGVYSPKGRVAFGERMSPECGPVGIICQSGGLGIDIVRRGQNRGLRFSGLVTVGNCADVKPSELLEYFLASADTSVIGLYLEGAGDGRRLFEVLRASRGAKPVVLLKGARTEQGRRAAASHTGALAASDSGWRALAPQTGVVLVDTLDAFLDALVVFQCLAVRDLPTRRVVLFGNGGGTSVLGADAFARVGFEVAPLEPETVAKLDALKLPAGSSVGNPIDVPAGALQQDEGRVAGRIMQALGADGQVDALVIHINMTVVLSFRHVDMLGNLMQAALRLKSENGKSLRVLLVLRSDGDADIEDMKRGYRARAMQAGIPVFDELAAAAGALAGLRHVEVFRESRRAPLPSA